MDILVLGPRAVELLWVHMLLPGYLLIENVQNSTQTK